MIEGIVFDFDGTMVDTETPIYESVRLVFADHGLEYPLERWLSSVGAAVEHDWISDLESILGGPLDRDLLSERRREYSRELMARQRLLPGVQALLDSTHTIGLPLAIASNSPYGWVDGMLRQLGLRERFVALSCVDSDARPKPAPDLYLQAVASLSIAPAAAVAFEDSPTGVAAARSAGLFTVGVPGGLTSALELGAHWEVRTLAEVTLAELRRRFREANRPIAGS